MRRLCMVFTMMMIFIGVLCATPDSLSSATRYESYAGVRSMGPTIIATTKWIGAIAEAAGAREVRVLLPQDRPDLSTYLPSPRDIASVSRADVILWSGQDHVVVDMARSAGLSSHRLFEVHASLASGNLVASVESVAKLLGTTEDFNRWRVEYELLLDSMKHNVEKRAIGSLRVAVHAEVQALIRSLGFDVVHVFDGKALSPEDRKMLEKLGPDLIIDSWKGNTVAVENTSVGIQTTLISSPGPYGTRSILDVIRYNARQLGLLD